MLTEEQARATVEKKIPEGTKITSVTDYMGYYVFGLWNPKVVGLNPLGVNKLTGTIKGVDYMNPGLTLAYRKQHPEQFED